MEQEEKERCRSEQRQWVQRFIPLCCVRSDDGTPILFDTPYNLPEIGHKPFSVAYNGVQAEQPLERLYPWSMWITHSKWLGNSRLGHGVSFLYPPTPIYWLLLHTLYHAKNMSSRSAWCYGRIERINKGAVWVVCYSISTSTAKLHFDAAQAIASLTDFMMEVTQCKRQTWFSLAMAKPFKTRAASMFMLNNDI